MSVQVKVLFTKSYSKMYEINFAREISHSYANPLKFLRYEGKKREKRRGHKDHMNLSENANLPIFHS